MLTEAFWPRDPRSRTEIESDVRAELQSHVAMLQEQLMQDGVDADEAHRQAAERFGDLDRYARQCERIDLGDRLWVRRLLSAACLLLLASTIALGWGFVDSRQTIARMRAEDQRDLVQQILELTEHMQTAFSFGPILLTEPPDEALAAVQTAWPRIEQTEVKRGLLKAFAFSKPLRPEVHPHVLQVLHLGMQDADPAVAETARVYLSAYAPASVIEDPQQYAAWYGAHRDASLPELLEMLSQHGE